MNPTLKREWPIINNDFSISEEKSEMPQSFNYSLYIRQTDYLTRSIVGHGSFLFPVQYKVSAIGLHF